MGELDKNILNAMKTAMEQLIEELESDEIFAPIVRLIKLKYIPIETSQIDVSKLIRNNSMEIQELAELGKNDSPVYQNLAVSIESLKSSLNIK